MADARVDGNNMEFKQCQEKKRNQKKGGRYCRKDDPGKIKP